jgi:ribosomal protein L40E
VPTTLRLRNTDMIIPIIMAIWYGVRARRLGRDWFGWALLGFFTPLIAATVATNVLGFLVSGGSMALDAETYTFVALGGVLTGILAGIVVGLVVLKPRVQEDESAAALCPFCGARNVATADKCKRCGARLGGD